MQQNQHAFKIISSLIKSNKVRYFSVNTTIYEYLVEKLDNGIFSIGKETGYDLVKTTVEGVSRLLDTFKKSLITEIVILKSRIHKRGSRKVYSLESHENRTNVLDDIRMHPKQIYLQDNECAICYEDDIPKKHSVTLNCQHKFCKDCFKGCLKSTTKVLPSCALCRADISSIIVHDDSVKSEFNNYLSV